jgi:signal peptidase I/conjugal transfer pilin signal peptidase TrbI
MEHKEGGVVEELNKKLSIKSLSFWKIVIVVLLLAIPGFLLPSKLVLCFGDSVKYKLFWKASQDDLSYDSYVVLKTSKEDPFAKGVNIVKRVGCLEGDELLIKGKDYYCIKKSDGSSIFLGTAKEKSMTGIKVNQFNPCGNDPCRVEVPKGYIFAIGDHKDSYDSRYFGWVPYERIVAVARPLF